jgi:hypothetical protein
MKKSLLVPGSGVCVVCGIDGFGRGGACGAGPCGHSALGMAACGASRWQFSLTRRSPR